MPPPTNTTGPSHRAHGLRLARPTAISWRPLLRLAGMLAIGASFASCVSLSAAGRSVKIGKSVPHQSCQELGIIYGSGSGGAYTSAERKLRSAQNQLRNKAAKLGGDFVVMDVAAGDGGSTTMAGRAYRCGTFGATPPAGAVQATPTAGSVAAPAKATVKERLQTLNSLRTQGLVTEAEYEQRRKQILDSL